MKTIETYLEEKGFSEISKIKNIPNHSGSHMSIEDLIRDYTQKSLGYFFESKSDANKYLQATRQEDVENDFKKFIKSI